jgi:uncharacterized protein YqgQ
MIATLVAAAAFSSQDHLMDKHTYIKQQHVLVQQHAKRHR